MLKLKYFLALAIIAAVNCDVEIPQKYWNAKPMSEHPKYKEQLQQLYPKMLESESHNPFIIGGSPATRGQFPHYTLIFIIYPDDTAYICGGSLIHARWVLTAAHCIHRDARNFNIYTGIVNIEGPASWGGGVQHSDIHIHPQYNASALRNDIAMIRLSTAPEDLLSYPYTGMIQLPPAPVSLVDLFGSVSGFGRTSDNSTYASDVMMHHSLRVMSNERCSAYYVPGAIFDTHICGETNATASTCSGDNGGPYSFVINGINRLEGIMSFYARSGCQLGYPVGFTRVSSYLRWINDTITGRTPDNEELWNDIRDLQEQYLITLQIIIEGANSRSDSDELWNTIRDLRDEYLTTLQTIIEGVNARKKEKILREFKLTML